MGDYDMDASADVFIATQGGTRSGTVRILWRMSVKDAQAVCSHPSTKGMGSGGAWMLCWTCHGAGDTVDSRLFVEDDGRFDALFEDLGVKVLASRKLILSGGVIRHHGRVQDTPQRLPEATQLDLFDEADEREVA